METNPFEQAARTQKAAKLAIYLAKAGIPVIDARIMPLAFWKLAATHVGVKPPSQKTIDEALRFMESYEAHPAGSRL